MAGETRCTAWDQEINPHRRTRPTLSHLLAAGGTVEKPVVTVFVSPVSLVSPNLKLAHEIKQNEKCNLYGVLVGANPLRRDSWDKCRRRACLT